jgi:hypothetical protein
LRLAALFAGLFCTFGVALDAFQTIILPRRPAGRFRITRLFYLATWHPWVAAAERLGDRKVRDQVYSIYGPLSLLLLLALWAVLLMAGFSFLYFAIGSPFADHLNPARSMLTDLRMDLYVSSTTLLSLGIVDVTPLTHIARGLIALESGTGLGLVALVIGYVPVLYQAFSRREVSVAMLDARAGSPPTATELLRRHGFEGGQEALIILLGEWERWAAEILESHISYPLLCYYRSQHDNQSWLSALTAILDTCALLITTVEGVTTRQAQLTFAMARHALIDLGHVFHVEKRSERNPNHPDRLPPEIFGHLCEALGELEMRLCGDPASMQRLVKIRGLYEPHAQSLADYLKMPLPLWIPEALPVGKTDQWNTVAGLRRKAADLPPGVELRAIHVSDRSTAAHLHDEEHGF